MWWLGMNCDVRFLLVWGVCFEYVLWCFIHAKFLETYSMMKSEKLNASVVKYLKLVGMCDMFDGLHVEEFWCNTR